ncbi:MAG TPA: HAD-IC family P-type ATPase [Candidatus Limnocylindrales bacterium]
MIATPPGIAPAGSHPRREADHEIVHDPATLIATHALAVSDVARLLRTDAKAGLADAEAAIRLASDGANELEPPGRSSLPALVVRAATEPFVLLLAVAGALAIALGEVRDGILVLFGLVPIVGADVATEYRGERALEELRHASAPRARVRRSGTVYELPAREIVAGDVVVLRVGDVVPADLRVTRTDSMLVDRSVLTGESVPEEATVAPDPPAASLVERRSVLYSGTAVVLGRGEGIAVATGSRSELGRIAGALGASERGRSPLQRELDRLVRILLVVAVGLIALTMGLGLLRGATLGEALLAGISSAIAAIPEEPPVLLAVVLGLGAYRLLRRGVLVRRLNAQETLGAVDLIITDKTGTLTENRLMLVDILSPSGPIVGEHRKQVLNDAVRAEEDAWLSGHGVPRGSFTRAIVAAFAADEPVLDRTDLLASHPPRESRPFSWTRSRRGERIEELALGAPEPVLMLSPASQPEEVEDWHRLVTASANAGRRLLLLSRLTDDGSWEPVALLAFEDRLRSGIPEALRTATSAGIQVIVVTGDHPATAASIAHAAGLDGEEMLTGSRVDAMNDGDLRVAIGHLHVVSRATPQQKLRLVELAQADGRTVAVTGDGVNDAPALERADVGVAMGSGTAVAREAADLVLGDDSFATLMDGLAEGRRIVANVQKGLVFLTSTHVALLGFILVATLAGYGQPLLPIQILWLELFIDLATSVAFEREPAEPDAMQRPPRPAGVPLLDRGLLARIAVAGGATALAALALMAWHDGGLEHARWLAFNVLVFGQLARAYANRSLERPVRSLPRNGFLALACVVAAVIQLAIPYLPPLADAFRASALDAVDLALVALVALTPAALTELVRGRVPGRWVA